MEHLQVSAFSQWAHGFYAHLYVDTFTDTFSQRFASLLEFGAEDNKRVVNERKLRSTATLVAVAMRFTIEKCRGEIFTMLKVVLQ